MVVAVVGLGLIGGSVSLGLLESGFATKIVGFDLNPEAQIHFGGQKGFEVAALSYDLARDADIWVLAVPPAAIPHVLLAIGPHVKPDAIVTDTASCKNYLSHSIPTELRSRFIGGHPMAGLAVSHHSFARGSLFIDSSWILCSWAENSKDSIWKVESMVYALDSDPTWMTPAAHDEHVALLSHVPHALAAIMVQMADELSQPELGGNSWRDLTRVAGNYPELWRQVMLSNRDSVVHQIDELQARLTSLKATLNADDSAAILAFFKRAEQIKLAQQPAEFSKKSPAVNETAEIDFAEESQRH